MPIGRLITVDAVDGLADSAVHLLARHVLQL